MISENFCLFDDNPEYGAFVEKFKPKKTTDDCYTPPNIFEAVKGWACEKYGIDPRSIVRPFYPGGDYENYDYPKGCVVLDNPPFSIISQICKYYTKIGIKYFLFAPALTLFSTASGEANYIGCGGSITYENGAIVNTSFVTNLGSKKIIVAPDLRERIDIANRENISKPTKQLPKYKYPVEVLTSAMLNYMAAYGVSLEICADDAHFIRGLDEQKKCGKTLFGAGFLISEKAAAEKAAAEKAAAEKAAAEVWSLSEREREIIEGLG